jgi:flagellar hook-length control protein FliK
VALIPPDAGIRMRMQTEASLLQPIAPVREVSGDLPEIQPGQSFTARVVEALPDNLYKALVAGKLLTLQLPEGAKPGDTLELVLVDRTARSLIAQRTEAQPAAQTAAQPNPNTTISRAGQMIGQLLPAEGESPLPAALTRGQPLLAHPPTSAAELAPALAKAVSQSGLFYEAHQAEWVAGRRPIESLQGEPHSMTQAAANRQSGAPPTATVAPNVTTAALPGTGQASEITLQPPANPVQAVPEELRPIVQQQLEAIATQRLAWHGEVWPDQVMHLEIGRERAEDRDAAATSDEAQRWNTTLRLTMPRLGAVDATLQLAGDALRVRLATTSDHAAADLRGGVQDLAHGMKNAGLTLQSVDVEHGRE